MELVTQGGQVFVKTTAKDARSGQDVTVLLQMTASNSDPCLTYVKVTKGTPLAKSPCRALLVGTPGTANLKDTAGTDCANFPLQQGYNPISVMSVENGGTADDIWALY